MICVCSPDKNPMAKIMQLITIIEFVAIGNHKVVAHHKEMNEFERELKQSNIAILDVVVEFIRDKRNEV